MLHPAVDPETILGSLNPVQRQAVQATKGPVLVLAGAGSGKTRVIAHRIAWLLGVEGINSRHVLAVTFTNKAAGEMKARTEALLPGAPLRSWISTFHSLCVRLLRREAAAAGLSPNFVIYDEDDQLQAVREALKALDLPEKVNPPRRLLSRISARKNSGRDPEDADADSVAAQTLSRVAERYHETLRAANALDFDDLLLRTASMLGGNEQVREAYRRRSCESRPGYSRDNRPLPARRPRRGPPRQLRRHADPEDRCRTSLTRVRRRRQNMGISAPSLLATISPHNSPGPIEQFSPPLWQLNYSLYLEVY
jgi:hypothetical protein